MQYSGLALIPVLLSRQNNLTNLILRFDCDILPHQPTKPAHLSVRTDWFIAAVRTNKMTSGCFDARDTGASQTWAEEKLSSHLNSCTEMLRLTCLGQLSPLCWKTGAFCVAKCAHSVLQPHAVWPSSFDKFFICRFFPQCRTSDLIQCFFFHLYDYFIIHAQSIHQIYE